MAKKITGNFRKNPLEKANIFSVIVFWWLNEFFNRGQKKKLVEEDQYRLLNDDTSQNICTRLESNWKQEVKAFRERGRKPSLFRAVVKTHLWGWLAYGILAVLEEALMVVTPLLLGGVLRYFEGNSTLQDAYLCAAGMFGVTLSVTLLHHVYFYQLQRMGWHIRAGACALMYKKTLKLSQRALASATTGQIVNLGATDVIRFDLLTLFLHFMWITPAQCLVVCYLLWQDIGPSCLVGLAIMVLMMTVQSSLGRAFGRIRAKMAVLTDERIRTMNEVITAMRIIKMYTWEKPFEKLIGQVRRKEIGKVMLSSVLKAGNISMAFASSRLLIFATFALYALLGGRMTPSKVFSAIGLFNVLRVTIGVFFPMAIEKLSESLISMRRIQNFLLLDEFPTSVALKGQRTEYENEKEKAQVVFENFTASWSEDKDEDSQTESTLTDISVKIDRSKLLAVIGPVGSGKSSFLSAILRELPASSGESKVAGQVAYAGQVPWVFSGTIKENILFGEAYDEARYRQVIECCALRKDIDSLDNGDETLVGERGVTLSGGQKARVNLARAAYRENTDIVLMDDPLSAVDANVANQLFHQCICGYMKDKIRVLVTHQLQFLNEADEILIFKFGEISGRGTFSQLQADGTDFASLLKTDDADGEGEHMTSPPSSPSREEGVVANGLFGTPLNSRTSSKRNVAEVDSIGSPSLVAKKRHLKSVTSVSSHDGTEPLLEKDKAEFVASIAAEETRVQGSIGWRVYAEYWNTNKPLLALLVVLMVANHVLFLVCDWWISVWATQSVIFYSQLEQLSNQSLFNATFVLNTTSSPSATSPFTTAPDGVSPQPDFDDTYYVLIFGILTLLFVIVMFARSILHFCYLVISGRKMHDKMFHAILRAPIRFFDVNPVGRILNRFSKDMGQIDELLPVTMMDFLYIFGSVLCIILLCVAVNYFVLLMVIPLLIYFVWLRQYYIRTSRDIKRMEGASRSPVFSHLSTTIQGLTTIRAFRMQGEFETEFHELQDLHSCSWFLFLNGSRWLAVRLDLLSALFAGTVALSSVLTASFLDNDAGKIGLAVSYALMVMGMFQWGVRQSTEVENLMTSVERVQEYYKIPPEAPHELPDRKPPSDWPKYGIITFDNLSYAHYKGGPDVLHKIRLNVRAHEKVGVVGRTGAGKSSLISTLFRLNGYSAGEVYIDGVGVSSLGLADLRSAISVIPQDPILFAGSLRKNLDPFSVYIDAELWDALEQVQLKSFIESFPQKLEYEVSESGTNFSVGQRQLICLARAILRKNKILIVDEATANVDVRTDRLIQLTLRSTFKHCTVLTVAHRINTIIDSDRVLVLNAGKVVEFDEPYLLLSKPNGEFAAMVDSAGKTEARELREIARKVYEEAHNPSSSADLDDAQRSYLARFLPVPGSYDHLELESNV